MRSRGRRRGQRGGRRALGWLIPLVLVAGCAPLPELVEDWPAGIPPRSHYKALYAADKVNQAAQEEAAYLTWVKRFYSGWFAYPGGWSSIHRDVVDTVAADRRQAMHKKMQKLGLLISGEWAKNSKRRVIRNRTIAAWGQAVVIAGDRGELEPFLERIEKDVDALFAGTLKPADIDIERYFDDIEEAQEEQFLFGP